MGELAGERAGGIVDPIAPWAGENESEWAGKLGRLVREQAGESVQLGTRGTKSTGDSAGGRESVQPAVGQLGE